MNQRMNQVGVALSSNAGFADDHGASSRKRMIRRTSIFLVAAMLLAHAPLLIRLARRMWALDHYQFFPAILLGAAYLGYQRWDRQAIGNCGHWFWRLALSLASLVLLATAILLDSPWIAALSAMLTLGALTYVTGGGDLWRRVWPAWAFLWLAVPLPMGLDVYLITELQRLATQWASGVLDLFEYRHLVSGVVLELPGRAFEVEEACSGIHSLFAALTCTAFYSIQLRRGLLRFGVLILATVFWVLVANAFRVTLVTVLCTRWDLPISEGLGHDMVGAVTFVISLLMIASTERLLLLLFPYPFSLSTFFSRSRRRRGKRWSWLPWRRGKRARIDAKKSLEPVKNQGITVDQPPVSTLSVANDVANDDTNWRAWELGLLGVLFALVGVSQFAVAGVLGKTHADKRELRQISLVTADALPTDLAGWQQVGFQDVTREADDPNGELSRLWRYQRGDEQLMVSIDGPFVGWHNLSGCLQGQGWEVTDSMIGSTPRENASPIPYSRLSVQKGLGRYATAHFAVFDHQNRPATPAETYAGFRAIRRFPKLSEFIGGLMGTDNTVARADSTTYQIQLFQETTTPESAQRLDTLQSLFDQVLTHLIHDRVSATQAGADMGTGN